MEQEAADRMVVAQYEITYPRQFNFDNLKKFYFKLPANINGNYIEISNFSYGTTAPVLYDLNKWEKICGRYFNPHFNKSSTRTFFLGQRTRSGK